MNVHLHVSTCMKERKERREEKRRERERDTERDKTKVETAGLQQPGRSPSFCLQGCWGFFSWHQYALILPPDV